MVLFSRLIVFATFAAASSAVVIGTYQSCYPFHLVSDCEASCTERRGEVKEDRVLIHSDRIIKKSAEPEQRGSLHSDTRLKRSAESEQHGQIEYVVLAGA